MLNSSCSKMCQFSFQEGTDSERKTRGLTSSRNIRKQFTRGKPQQEQCHCPKKQQLFRPISSFTTEAYLPKFRRRVISRPKKVVERKGPQVKYGGCDSKSFQIVECASDNECGTSHQHLRSRALPNLKNVLIPPDSHDTDCI